MLQASRCQPAAGSPVPCREHAGRKRFCRQGTRWEIDGKMQRIPVFPRLRVCKGGFGLHLRAGLGAALCPSVALGTGVSSNLLSARWRWCARCCRALFCSVGFHPELPVLGWQIKSLLSIWAAQASWEEQSVAPASPGCWEIHLPVQGKGSGRGGGGVTQAT